jgi:hypothetical protein
MDVFLNLACYVSNRGWALLATTLYRIIHLKPFPVISELNREVARRVTDFSYFRSARHGVILT